MNQPTMRDADMPLLDRIDAAIKPPRSWPVWLTMIVPPIKRPCSQRIEREKETT